MITDDGQQIYYLRLENGLLLSVLHNYCTLFGRMESKFFPISVYHFFIRLFASLMQKFHQSYEPGELTGGRVCKNIHWWNFLVQNHRVIYLQHATGVELRRAITGGS